MPMPSFGRGGARSGSMIGRRNLPGTGRGFNGSLLRTRVGRSPWALARAKARSDSRPDDRRTSSASDPVKRPRRSCTESSWGNAPDYGCTAYDDRVDAAVRAGAVLFPKRSPW